MIERITKLITESGMSARKVLINCGIAESSLVDWKKGKGKPSTDAIIKLANYFKVSTDYLLTGKDFEGQQLTKDELEIIKCYREITISFTRDLFNKGFKKIMEDVRDWEEYDYNKNQYLSASDVGRNFYIAHNGDVHNIDGSLNKQQTKFLKKFNKLNEKNKQIIIDQIDLIEINHSKNKLYTNYIFDQQIKILIKFNNLTDKGKQIALDQFDLIRINHSKQNVLTNKSNSEK